MARKTTVAVRFTKDIAEVRRVGFVDELSKLIVFRLQERRPGSKLEQTFRQQWFRLGDDKLVYIVNIWGEHETIEVRDVVSKIATECDEKALPVVLDIIME
ncbi:MAG TPA: hypothetical protein VHF22_07985 [Planctomycetota bacterium]|nr:hypothetical protein [Planctomycetota bacterium]